MAAVVAKTVSSTSSETTAPVGAVGATEYVVVDGSYFQKVNDTKVKIKPPSDKKMVSEKADEKDRNSPSGPNAILASTAVALMKSQMRGSKAKSIKVTLIGQYTSGFTSSGNSVLLGSVALTPIGVQDWSSFGAVYDICRVAGLTIHAQMTYSAAPPQTTTGWWAFAFDPITPGGYGSAVDILTAKFHKGPLGLNFQPNTGVSNTQVGNTTTVVTESGFHKMRFNLPARQLIVNDQVSPVAGGGGWFATGSTTFVCGYLKTYQPALGTSSVSQVTFLVEYHVEFKVRT